MCWRHNDLIILIIVSTTFTYEYAAKNVYIVFIENGELLVKERLAEVEGIYG